MVEHGLWEGLASRCSTQVSGETEGLVDGQVSLDSEHGRSRALFFREHLSTTLVQTGVDTTDGILGALNFHYGEVC